MTEHRQRRSDKAPYRYRTPIHIISGLVIGWHLSKWFPQHDQIIDLIGATWSWTLSAFQSLGGLAVLSSAGLTFYTIYEKIKARKK